MHNMAELDIDLDSLEREVDINNKVERRIKDLSEKVRLTSTERDELAQAKQALESEKQVLSKERDFYASFTDSTAKYPGAHEFKDKIREKVMAGYDVEDATVAVLAKEGKLSSAESAPVVEKSNPAGGSATTALKGTGQKSIGEMSRDEMRQALMDAETRGDISMT